MYVLEEELGYCSDEAGAPRTGPNLLRAVRLPPSAKAAIAEGGSAAEGIAAAKLVAEEILFLPPKPPHRSRNRSSRPLSCHVHISSWPLCSVPAAHQQQLTWLMLRRGVLMWTQSFFRMRRRRQRRHAPCQRSSSFRGPSPPPPPQSPSHLLTTISASVPQHPFPHRT